MDLFPNCPFAKFSPTLFKYVKNLAKEKLAKISHFLICPKLRKTSIQFAARNSRAIAFWLKVLSMQKEDFVLIV